MDLASRDIETIGSETRKTNSPDFHVYHISEPQPNEIWICGSRGLTIFDGKKMKTSAVYDENQSAPFYLPLSGCFFHHQDRNGIHWLGCDDGLVRWDKSKGTYRRFTVADGLPNDVIYAISEDEAGNLWLSSDYGIIRFDPRTYQVESFLPHHGISHHEFNRISAGRGADGSLYFGGLNGITAFHPQDFISTKKEPPYSVQVTDLQILKGKPDTLVDFTQDVRESHRILFEPDDRFMRLRFALPILNDAANTLYAWRVEGLDADWNYQKEHTIQVSKVPYGEYTLAIKGQDNSRNWTKELRIQIIAPAPFYVRIWFLVLMGVLLMLSVFALFKYRTRTLRRRQKALENEVNKATAQLEQDKQTIEAQADELKELDRVKSRFFANVSHELRTPLSLILGPLGSVLKSGDLSARNLKFLRNAQRNGKDLMKLVGALLDLSKMESGKMALQEEAVLVFSWTR
ncbi:MAG: histidine kinase dimerization/phospho-acceptor domain-containing protein, partial [Bacteroidota bacterium]